MEEKIKRVVSRTKMMFVYFWLLPVFLVTFGETGGEWVGAYAGDVRAAYFAETVTILLTAVLVPVSLKLFSWMKKPAETCGKMHLANLAANTKCGHVFRKSPL